jgi:hypothetical protein
MNEKHIDSKDLGIDVASKAEAELFKWLRAFRNPQKTLQ